MRLRQLLCALGAAATACTGVVGAPDPGAPAARTTPAAPGDRPHTPPLAAPPGTGEQAAPEPAPAAPVPPASRSECAAVTGAVVTRAVEHAGGGREISLRMQFADGVPVPGRDLRGCLSLRDARGPLAGAVVVPRAPAAAHTLILVDPGQTAADNRLARELALAVLRSRPAGEPVALWRWGPEVTQVAAPLADRALLEARLQAGLVPAGGAPRPIDEALAAVAPVLSALGGVAVDSARTIVVVAPREVAGVGPDTIARAAPHLVAWVVPRDGGALARHAPEGLRFSVQAAGGPAAAAAALGQRLAAYRAGAHLAVGLCAGPGPLEAELRVEAGAAAPLSLPAVPPELRGGTCEGAAAAAGRRAAPRRIDLSLTPEQRAQAEAAAVTREDFGLSVRLSPEQQPIPATAHFRGNGSYGCARRNYSVNLDGKAPRFVLPEAATGKFFLISNCLDRLYLRGFTSYQLMAEEGLFPPRFEMVELFVDGATRGVYTLIENPTSAVRQRFSGVTDVVRRRFDRRGEVPEVKWSATSEELALGSYRAAFAAVQGLTGALLDAGLRARLDLDRYLLWVALVNALGSGDYVDEVYFFQTETTGPDGAPAGYYSVVGWDQDDIFTRCHVNPGATVYDPHGLLGCAETDFDRKIFGDGRIYARYVEVLSALLDRLTRERFERALAATSGRLLSFFRNPETLAAMTELGRWGIAPGLPAVEDAIQRDAAALAARYDEHRRLLLQRIQGYRRAAR